MKAVQLPDEVVAGLEAVAALDGATVTELAAGALVDLLAERYHAVQAAYVALRELDPDNGRPTRAAAPVSTNGHGPPPTPTPAKKKAAKAAARTCDRPRCDGRVKGRGMCTRHYNRWYAGRDLAAPDGTPSPAAPEDTQEGEPDPGPAPRTHDVDEGGRQDSQPSKEAGDGPPSSTSTTVQAVPDQTIPPDGGTVELADPAPEVEAGDPMCCTAARCRSSKETIDDEFCPTHLTILRRMVAKLRAEFGEDARDEAADRLVAGVR